MCGIAGVIFQGSERPSEETLRRMGDVMAHRGPDDAGVYTAPGVGLSHRRLSIIDLTSDGHQPMCNEDGTIWLVFNGEIYNYQELAQELVAYGHRFKSRTDSEVIIHAYEEWGRSCVSRFNGMFSFGIWDESKRIFWAARDRLGIKPFYYWQQGSTLIFGSEIKAVLAHPKVSARPNNEAIHEYLIYGHPMAEACWFEGVAQLMPGCTLEYGSDGLRLDRYWDLQFDIDYERNRSESVEALQQLLLNAVQIHQRSDVEVGAHLSGGIDSSSIVAMASGEFERFHTFSAAYPVGREFDERPFIDVVSERFGTVHHVVTPSFEDVEQNLSRILWHMDEPVIGPSVLPMFRVNEAVRKSGVTVVSGGQGGDEVFGGYPPFYALAAKNLVLLPWKRHILPPLSEIPNIPGYLKKGGVIDRLKTRFFPARDAIRWIRGVSNIRDRAVEDLRQWRRGHEDWLPFEHHSHRYISHYLRGLLHQEDRLSMAWSVESRVPLLDYRIVEFAAKLPSWTKIWHGVDKWILRQSMRGITPDPILNRTDKMGYPVPIRDWFSGPLRPFMQRTLVDSPLLSDEVLEPKAVKTMVLNHGTGGRDYSASLWLALTTELWFRNLDSGVAGKRYDT